jgi:hypothetical protein
VFLGSAGETGEMVNPVFVALEAIDQVMVSQLIAFLQSAEVTFHRFVVNGWWDDR